MRRITKFIILSAFISMIAALVFRAEIAASLAGVDAFVRGNTLGIVMLAVVAVLLLIVYPVIKYKTEWLGIRAAIGGRKKDKIYDVMEMIEAGLGFLRVLGIEEYAYQTYHRKLHIKAQLIDSPTSDTPRAFFLLSTSEVRLASKSMIFNIPEDDRHFIFIDRRTCECTYNPDINDWDAAMSFHKEMRELSVPLEMKKKPLEKALEEQIKRGYAQKIGESAASSSEKKEGGESNE